MSGMDLGLTLNQLEMGVIVDRLVQSGKSLQEISEYTGFSQEYLKSIREGAREACAIPNPELVPEGPRERVSGWKGGVRQGPGHLRRLTA